MKKDMFTLRHAALVAALALAMGAPLSFADELPVEPGSEVIEAPGMDVGIVVGDGALGDPAESGVGDDFTLDPPALPIEGDEVVVGDPIPVEQLEPMPEETAPVEDNDVVTLDTPTEEVPMDDCGVICQNVAGELPPEAVYRNEDIPSEVLQFSNNGESPAPSLDVSAELSGAIGAVEQLGAADIAVVNGTALEPLATSAPTAVVANGGQGDSVTVIRNGHLR